MASISCCKEPRGFIFSAKNCVAMTSLLSSPPPSKTAPQHTPQCFERMGFSTPTLVALYFIHQEQFREDNYLGWPLSSVKRGFGHYNTTLLAANLEKMFHQSNISAKFIKVKNTPLNNFICGQDKSIKAHLPIQRQNPRFCPTLACRAK